jgi:hypothetical protein
MEVVSSGAPVGGGREGHEEPCMPASPHVLLPHLQAEQQLCMGTVVSKEIDAIAAL